MADSNDPKTADEGTLRNSDNEEECKVASDEKADPKPAAEDISEDKIDEEKKCNVESDEKADPKTADENISSKADEEKECNVGSDERADPRPADAGTMSKKEEEKECNVEPGDKADPNPAAEDISDKIDGEKECKVESDEKSDPKPAAEYISEDNIDEEKECNVGSDEKADPKAAVEDTPSKSDQEKECNGESDEKAESNTAVEDSSSKSAQEKEYNGKMDEKTNEGSWIERSPDLIRLTGEYPFNSEPPLTELMKHGFTTPAEYHYVRNHGSVPRATWDKWTVEVSGLVDQPTHFTMSQLERDFQALTRQVTLVCSGNRRMEQNMVKPTNGFHWGAAAVSTSEWHGARLKDVLEKCGVQNGAVYVCFEGAEELSGGSKYGTSVKKEIAMDPTRDIIIAYKQGGEYLKPDHGYPVRIIIPGFIGGRMVKWLKRITVTAEESESKYHYKDNRVLPSHVDQKLADDEDWWKRPEYIINELNINSVITSPKHEEILPINSATAYKLKGYAYSGGGKMVTRVEVTMDGGDTWRICEIDRPEKPNKYGKYWCWCFWSLDVEILHLLGAKEIAVRAWDETLNTQPEKLTWNVMGMMNNCWFRVKNNICKTDQGEIGLMFEHPAVPGTKPGGWMVRQKQQKMNENQTMPEVKDKFFSMSEVKTHNSSNSVWIVVDGHVYDCTNYVDLHPGGALRITTNAGTDCTKEFNERHSKEAKAKLQEFRIGKLTTTTSETDSHKPLQCKLVSQTPVSEDKDVHLFHFLLSSAHVLKVPVGKHISLSATIDGKRYSRFYTPISFDEEGKFDLLIKIYRQKPPQFPNGGVMSQYLRSLPDESTMLDVQGPCGHIEYAGRGKFIVERETKFALRLAMVAGGTGITPIYRVMKAILSDPEDKTEMYLVYANRTEEDILLRKELDEWVSKHSNVKVWYVVEETKEGWKYSTGRIDESLLRKQHIPEGSEETLALACGPRGLIDTVSAALKNMNYDKKSLLMF